MREEELYEKYMQRSSDPDTSFEASEHLTATGGHQVMMQRAYELLLQNPGRTAKEIELVGGFDDGQIRKRLNDLRRKGKALNGPKRRCSITGRTAQTWKAAEK